MTVSLSSLLCSIRKQGSSSASRCRAVASFCSWPLCWGSIASPNIGCGKSIGFRRMWSSSWLSWSTASKWISSTLATAAMSPGTASSISTWSLPRSLNRWPTLNGFLPSSMNNWVSRRTVPW